MKNVSEQLNPAVVIPAFRRADSLRRLLQSVNDAHYPDEGCTLILSLEEGADDEVVRVAKDFQFRHGIKEVVRQPEQLGLKSHIYKCADYSQDYGSVIVLEDDLFVSPAYYLYAIEAMQAYQHEENVAGISLYAQRFNETAQLPFEPLPSYYAGYFMRLACSWGQGWTEKQWRAYQEWRETNIVPAIINDVRVPQNIKEWPAGSWKREFNIYLTKTGRTIFYPYQSLTTNRNAEGGENLSGRGTLFEVPLVSTTDGLDHLTFPNYDQAFISYDMYMEADGFYIEKVIGVSRDDLMIDLYGMKPPGLLGKKDYFITSKKAESPDIRFPLRAKPIEENLTFPLKESTEGFFLMAAAEKANSVKMNKNGYISLAQHLSYNRTDTKKFIFQNVKQSLKKKL